jgi:Mn2+/Fe2+ NRAMP family transporter
VSADAVAGSSAYAVSEAFGWREGLDQNWHRAKPFYAVVTAATLVGVLIPFTGVKPIDALFLTSVLNGVAAPPLLVLIMLAGRDRRVVGGQTIGPVLTVLGWAVTVSMFLALAVLAFSFLGG